VAADRHLMANAGTSPELPRLVKNRATLKRHTEHEPSLGTPGATLAAIEGIYRSQLPEFRRATAAITGDRELACDSVQDAFARAVCRRAGFRGEGSLHGWIWRIVINTTVSQTRARRPTSPLAGDPSTSDNGHTDAATERVRSALALLPERQRLILFLHYYADLDYATIAEAIGITTGTVGATLHRARANMRRRLEEPT
jgi:RNA polymerase sigma-70 factor (ECF subfamily)